MNKYYGAGRGRYCLGVGSSWAEAGSGVGEAGACAFETCLNVLRKYDCLLSLGGLLLYCVFTLHELPAEYEQIRHRH